VSNARTYREYVESSAAEIDADRQTLLNKLLTDHRGYDSRVSARELSDHTGINESTIRDVIIELRDEFGVPIANIGSGYFLIETGDELDRVVEYYQQEIATKQERMQTIVQAANNHRYE